MIDGLIPSLRIEDPEPEKPESLSKLSVAERRAWKQWHDYFDPEFLATQRAAVASEGCFSQGKDSKDYKATGCRAFSSISWPGWTKWRTRPHEPVIAQLATGLLVRNDALFALAGGERWVPGWRSRHVVLNRARECTKKAKMKIVSTYTDLETRLRNVELSAEKITLSGSTERMPAVPAYQETSKVLREAENEYRRWERAVPKERTTAISVAFKWVLEEQNKLAKAKEKPPEAGRSGPPAAPECPPESPRSPLLYYYPRDSPHNNNKGNKTTSEDDDEDPVSVAASVESSDSDAFKTPVHRRDASPRVETPATARGAAAVSTSSRRRQERLLVDSEDEED